MYTAGHSSTRKLVYARFWPPSTTNSCTPGTAKNQPPTHLARRFRRGRRAPPLLPGAAAEPQGTDLTEALLGVGQHLAVGGLRVAELGYGPEKLGQVARVYQVRVHEFFRDLGERPL